MTNSIPRLRLYWEFSRPFTLIAPALGMLSGGVTALGAGVPTQIGPGVLADIAIGTLMAAVLNAASNGINQIYDLEVDRVNKPARPIPSGRLSIAEAKRLSWTLYLIALALAATVNWQCFLLAAIAALLTIVYSAPPLRTKRHPILANVTIALPRGLMLKVAGWTTVKSAFDGVEPWFIGSIFGLFLLGASSTKDFADMKGDEAGGCMTLPVKYGPTKAAWLIAPFFVLPFLLIPIGWRLGWLSGVPWALDLLGLVLTVWGAYTIALVLRDPDALARTENHPSWSNMYRMMFLAQLGFAAAYLLKYAR